MTITEIINQLEARVAALEARVAELEQMNDAQEVINKRTNEVLEHHAWQLRYGRIGTRRKADA